MPRLHAALLLLFFVPIAHLVSGCASPGGGVVARTASATPWIVPPQEHGTQRLFQARLESTQGSGRFRLLLRLRDPQRYQIRATHPLFNRRLWSLDVEGDHAVLVDHHQHTVCRYQDEAEIGAIPMGPFPFESLPALLLGYLPLAPAKDLERPTSGLIAFDDELGRRWTAVLDGGIVRRWEVAGDEIGNVSWERREDWDVLQAPQEELDVRFRETLREELAGGIDELQIPADYDAERGCDLGWLRAVEDAPWEKDRNESDGTH